MRWLINRANVMDVNVVFFGGARRVTLAEQIRSICSANNITPKFFSIEKNNDFYPISNIAEILSGPKFESTDFDNYLSALYEALGLNTLFIACMDAGIPALARFAERCQLHGVKVIAPTSKGAEIALDKLQTDEFFAANEISRPARIIPHSSFHGRVIAKPIQGFGGKGITIFESGADVPRDIFQTHIVQEFLEGSEVTHDLYIAESREFFAASRDRLAVIDGEVDHCIVRKPIDIERSLLDKIVKTGFFRGPITVQTIQNSKGCHAIEINARFGGGVTAAIQAGFPGVEFLLSESFGCSIQLRQFQSLEMKRARRDFYRILT